MWWLPLWVAFFIWTGAEDPGLLEPPWQWGRIVAVGVCVLVATILYAVDRLTGDE